MKLLAKSGARSAMGSKRSSRQKIREAKRGSSDQKPPTDSKPLRQHYQIAASDKA